VTDRAFYDTPPVRSVRLFDGALFRGAIQSARQGKVVGGAQNSFVLRDRC
jgi:hypothetical protein